MLLKSVEGYRHCHQTPNIQVAGHHCHHQIFLKYFTWTPSQSRGLQRQSNLLKQPARCQHYRHHHNNHHNHHNNYHRHHNHHHNNYHHYNHHRYNHNHDHHHLSSGNTIHPLLTSSADRSIWTFRIQKIVISFASILKIVDFGNSRFPLTKQDGWLFILWQWRVSCAGLQCCCIIYSVNTLYSLYSVQCIV